MIDGLRMPVWNWRKLDLRPYVPLSLLSKGNKTEGANDQNPEERVDHLQKAAKFFGEHKDRAFEAKVSPIFTISVEKELMVDGRRC
jgi:hypothetical protein